MLILACMGLISLSALGILRPVEGLLDTPLSWFNNIFTQTSEAVFNGQEAMNSVEVLRERNAELERQLAQLQGELVNLREIAADYARLTELLDYVNQTDSMEFVTADVIGTGLYGFINSAIINKGTRDGLVIGMPVVTELGLVGRVWQLTANTAQIQLVTDQNSNVSARLQNSRAEGTIEGEGLLDGSLELLYVDLDVEITPGELVYSSGLGGNFPADIALGQIISISNVQSELTQTAQVRSLVNFATLQQVLIVTNFEPADLTVFETTER